MLSAVSVTNPVFTPLHGWAVFGGSAGVTKVQVLSGLDRTWSYVADMYQQSSNERHCTMQVPISFTEPKLIVTLRRSLSVFDSFTTLDGSKYHT